MKRIYLILFVASMFMVSCDKANDCEEIQSENQELTIPNEIKSLMETGSVRVNVPTRGLQNDRIITTNAYLNSNGKEYDVAYFYEDDNLKIPMVLEYPVKCNYTIWSIGVLNGDPVSMDIVYTKTVTIPAGVVSHVLYSGTYTPPVAGGVDYRRYAITNSMVYIK